MDIAEPFGRRHAGALTLSRRQALAAAALPWTPNDKTGSGLSSYRLEGMVWQPSASTMRPQGDWGRLGIQRLLVQWTAVDNQSLMPGVGLPLNEAVRPDWSRIAAEPWAHEVILGLAGTHSETRARQNLLALAAQSRDVMFAAAAWPLRIKGWYFPVEADPTWSPPPEWPAALQQLPRPLWVSVYDRANLGAATLLEWINRWVPSDVGIFFQDGVGVHARTPEVAHDYLKILTGGLGRARVQVIAEAFRPLREGGFRSATADEFLPQIAAYQGWSIFAFDGPHYLSASLIQDLQARGVGAR